MVKEAIQDFEVDMPSAEMKDYEQLMEDRPRKFTARAAWYHQANKNEFMCADCIHLFTNDLDKYSVCEVVRPKQDRIEPTWTCKFQTRNGKDFPLYKGGKE
jgi:hypothetical protein